MRAVLCTICYVEHALKRATSPLLGTHGRDPSTSVGTSADMARSRTCSTGAYCRNANTSSEFPASTATYCRLLTI